MTAKAKKADAATAELRIAEIGHRGDGIAETAKGPVYVPLTAPGDLIEAEVMAGRGRLLRLIEPSPERVTPPCPHFGPPKGFCGGCQLQHMPDGWVAAWKRELVVAALAQRGIEAEVAPTVTVPPATRRRAALAARRSGAGVALGFHEHHGPRIEDITACHVLAPAIMRALPGLRDLMAATLTRRGEAKLTVLASDSGIDLAVDLPGRELDGALLADLSARGIALDLARLAWNGELVAEWRAPTVHFDGIAVAPPPGGFLQAAEEAEAALRNVAREALTGARHVADLFCGSGAFALPLARDAKVDAFDSEAAAIAALDAGARHAKGLKTVRAETRDLFRRPLLADELKPYDAILFDPPRAGAKAQAAEIAKARAPVVVGISCSPASFARDARTLIDGGYSLAGVVPVDQFRWSAHVELAAVFHRH